MKRTLISAGVAAAALLIGITGSAQAQDKIRLGGILALSGGGVASGLSYRAGMEMATAEINKAGGINGKQIELTFADDQSDATAAVGEAKRLVFQEKISLFVGPLFSGQALAAAPVFAEGKAVSINASGSSRIGPKDTPNSFSIFLDVDTQSQAMIDYVSKTLKAKSMAVLADNGQQAREMIERFRDMAPKAGITLSGVQEYQVNQADMTPELLSLRRTNPQVLFVNGISGADFGRIIKAREDLGWNVPIAATAVLSYLYSEVIKTVPPEKLDGASSQTFAALTYCPNDPVGASTFAQFRKRLEGFAGDRMKNLAPLNVASGYDATMIYRAAIAATGGTDGTAVVKWIQNNSDKVTGNVIGKFSASPTKHFLFGPEVLAMAERFDRPREDGLFRRTGC